MSESIVQFGRSVKELASLLLWNRHIRRQLRAQAPLQLLAQLRDLHSRHDDKFAAQHFARLIIVGQLARHAAILALLIPAKASVRNRLRADELEAAQQRV